MEFAQARIRTRREGYNYCEDDEQDEPAAATSQHHPLTASSSRASPAAVRWGPPTENPSPSSSSSPIDKEHMFDKVVTPSDVGKLNRLVIPKQHAEKYFPLDTSTHEKGLLLNFEDRNGKPWRFRYSYWNSSQSYVMTKGWSRFVKEKHLDAGDTVSFGRSVDDKDRFFIDWKRRPEILHNPPRGLPRIPLPLTVPSSYHHPTVSFVRSVSPWAGRWLVPPASSAFYDVHRQNYVYNAAGGSSGGGQCLVFRSTAAPPQDVVQLGSGDQNNGKVGAAAPMVLESVPVVPTQAAAKRVRLFGVNLDLPDHADGDRGDSSIRSHDQASPSPKGKEKQQPSLDLEM